MGDWRDEFRGFQGELRACLALAREGPILRLNLSALSGSRLTPTWHTLPYQERISGKQDWVGVCSVRVCVCVLHGYVCV